MNLEGAELNYAGLQGASLFGARLHGASLYQAQVQGASLDQAQLQGASLDQARLQGASLESARLQGASLVQTQLQGASLKHARLTSASFDNVYVFRTPIDGVEINDASVDNPVYEAKYKPSVWTTVSKLTDNVVQKWTIVAIEHGDYEEENEQIEQRLGRLMTGGATADEDAAVTKFWLIAAQRAHNNEAYLQDHLAERLAELVCSADNAPYVARGLIRNRRLQAIGQHLQAVANPMKKARSDPPSRKARTYPRALVSGASLRKIGPTLMRRSTKRSYLQAQ